MRRSGLVAALAIAVALLLLLPGLAPNALPSSNARGVSGAGSNAGALAAAGASPTTARSPSSSPCPGFAGLWAQVYPGLALPPSPAPGSLSGCVVGPDESGLSFVSNASGTGQRSQVALTLPPAGTATAATLARLSLRSWASGVPCSLDGAVEVSIDLIPPLSPYASGPSLNWSVAAPAFDLVPPASCDPRCTNDTAFTTFEGARFCEEEVVATTSGAPPVAPVPGPSPGDNVTITTAGGATAANPLTVWLNDSTRPSADLSFRYTAGAMRLGTALTSIFLASALGQPTWGMSSALSLVATNCPLPVNGGSACDSYDPTLWSGVAPAVVDRVGFFNTSDGLYDLPYSAVGVASSTGACAGGPVTCASGRVGSFYPSWSLGAESGHTTWSYGVAGSGALRAFPTGAASLTPRAVPPLALGAPTLIVGVSTAVVSERVTDPTGVAAVNLTVSFCAPTSASASLGPGPLNTSSDGVWSATIPASTHSGTVPLLATVTTFDGSLLGPAVETAQVAGSNPACPHSALPAPSGVGGLAIAQGYLVNWTSLPLGTAAVVVQAASTDGLTVNTTVAPESPAAIDLGRSNVSYNLSAATLNAWGDLSAFSPSVAVAPTLAPVNDSFPLVTLTSPWLGMAVTNVSGTASGGLPPYLVDVAFGDGSETSAPTSGPWSFTHAYAGFYGVASLRVTVTDALGETLTLAPPLLSILATPLEVHAAAVGGDSVVSLSWQAPVSPAASASSYRVFSTSNASLAHLLASAGTSNATFPGILVWNTTSTFDQVSVANGGVLYAQVVAVNVYGNGALPAGAAVPLVGRPAPFLLSPIVTDPGGPAPLHDNFSATATLGSNDSVVEAFYSFPDGTLASTTPTFLNGTFYLNASYEFVSPGSYVVVLHAIDVFFETQIVTTEVRVSPGAPPTLSAIVVSGISYAGSAVDFEAMATGGSGVYAVNWSFGDGTTGNGTTTAHLYASPGTYSVLVSAYDTQTGGSAAYLFSVLVYAIPTIFVSVTPGPNGSLSYDFRAAVGGGSGPASVVWTFGDGGVGRGAEVTHDYLDRGTYTVNVTATDPSGRAGETSFNLSANPSSTGGGGSGAAGLSLLDVGLAAAAALLLIVVLVLSARRRAPPGSAIVPAPATEDGEVSLT